MSLGNSSLGTTNIATRGGAFPSTLSGGLPTETDAALTGTITVGIRLTGGLATETDSALHGTILSGQIINLGLATETDTAFAGTVRVGVRVTGGLATETDAALSLTLSVVNLGRATEADTALTGSMVAHGTILGIGVEVDTALAGSVDEGYTRTVLDRRGGRTRSGLGVASWEPAVAPIPAGLSVGVTIDTAFAFTSATVNGAQVVLEDVIKASTTRDRYRITVGGVDVTFFRGINTPELDYDLIQPLMYGPGTLRLPQVKLALETPGAGDLSWLKPDAKVKQQRIASDGTKTTDYIGFVVAFDTSGNDLTVQLGGIASGAAALMEHPLPLFKHKRDLGRRAWLAMHDIGLNLRPFLGPTTGIDIQAFGGTSHLDYINQLCALGVTKAGDQWTIMPNTNGTWHLSLKDTDTIHGTVYADDDYVKANLRRDTAEEPNRIFGTGVTPDGMRVLGGVYPGLKQGRPAPYPMTDGSSFGVGTTDADTDTGDGVSVMINRLQVFGYLTRRDSPGGYDSDVADAIEALQDDANLAQAGTMTRGTWAALFDLDVTGASLAWSHIEPLAQTSATRKWKRTGSGSIIARNPNYDRRVRKRDRTVDFGTGFERSQMVRWARAEKVKAASPNWVGDLVFETGALVAGEHTPGDPLTEADVMCALDLRPGMNLWLPHFDGGTKVHVSACSVSGGKVTASVDTRARDTMQAWQVIARNRETRKSPRRAFIRDHSSGMMRDAIGEWSEVGGMLGSKVDVRGGRWTVFEVIAGQAGTVGRLDVRTTPNAEFAMAVFAKKIDPARLNALVPNPLASKSNWMQESTRNKLDDKLLLYAAGDPDQPLGYHPAAKTNPDGTPGGTLTGEWKDEAGFGYQTFQKPVLYVAIYADRDTVIPAGRIMWPQQEPA